MAVKYLEKCLDIRESILRAYLLFVTFTKGCLVDHCGCYKDGRNKLKRKL